MLYAVGFFYFGDLAFDGAAFEVDDVGVVKLVVDDQVDQPDGAVGGEDVDVVSPHDLAQQRFLGQLKVPEADVDQRKVKRYFGAHHQAEVFFPGQYGVFVFFGEGFGGFEVAAVQQREELVEKGQGVDLVLKSFGVDPDVSQLADEIGHFVIAFHASQVIQDAFQYGYVVKRLARPEQRVALKEAVQLTEGVEGRLVVARTDKVVRLEEQVVFPDLEAVFVRGVDAHFADHEVVQHIFLLLRPDVSLVDDPVAEQLVEGGMLVDLADVFQGFVDLEVLVEQVAFRQVGQVQEKQVFQLQPGGEQQGNGVFVVPGFLLDLFQQANGFFKERFLEEDPRFQDLVKEGVMTVLVFSEGQEAVEQGLVQIRHCSAEAAPFFLFEFGFDFIG